MFMGRGAGIELERVYRRSDVGTFTLKRDGGNWANGASPRFVFLFFLPFSTLSSSSLFLLTSSTIIKTATFETSTPWCSPEGNADSPHS